MTDLEQEVAEDNPGFHLFAKFGLAIESLADGIQKINEREQRRLAGLPINYPFQRLSAPAIATDFQDFGGPQPGRVWVVRLLSGFASPIAANAAVVSWYVGQIMPGDAAGQLPLTMKRWEFGALPAAEKFTSDVLVVRNTEKLIAGLTGVPASSRIVLNAVVNDQPAWAARYGTSQE